MKIIIYLFHSNGLFIIILFKIQCGNETIIIVSVNEFTMLAKPFINNNLRNIKNINIIEYFKFMFTINLVNIKERPKNWVFWLIIIIMHDIRPCHNQKSLKSREKKPVQITNTQDDQWWRRSNRQGNFEEMKERWNTISIHNNIKIIIIIIRIHVWLKYEIRCKYIIWWNALRQIVKG